MEDKVRQVLLWGDFKEHYLKQLARRLKPYCPDCKFVILNQIWELKNEDYDLSDYDVIILQATDVTKFSAVEEEREAIGDRLEEFVSDDKKLIVSHDVIYRRTRNELLQEMYGYKINNFARQAEVKYHKTPFCKNTNAFELLESSFMLSDGELCWGDVSRLGDKMVFFETNVEEPLSHRKINIPLVFGKTYNGGQLLWFNTGDAYDDPPQPIASLDDNYVKLLAECINIDMTKLSTAQSDGAKYLPYLHECDFSRPYSFISYSSKNCERVYEICLFLDMLGINYYLDVKNITSTTPGTDGWRQCVNEAIDNPNCVSAFVMLSEDYLYSEHCNFEIARMDVQGGKFVPVLLSISFDFTRIPEIMSTWSPTYDEDRIANFRKLLALKKKPDSKDWEINQLVFYCHRNLSQFENVQLINTIKKVCGVGDEAFAPDNLAHIRQRCKDISESN